MKNIITTITTISFSLFAITVSGQFHPTPHLISKADNPSNISKNRRLIRPHKDSVITFPYSSTDSVQTVAILMNSLSIPSSARKGWNFGINMIVKGSKLDTVGIWYYSQGTSSCAAVGGYYTNALTSIGAYISPAVPNANSFVTGLSSYNTTQLGGDDSVMTWPTITGPRPGYCVNSGGFSFYNLLPDSACTDTAYFPVQDMAIATSITYNSGQHALVNYVMGDEYLNPAGTFYYWYPSVFINSNYTLADTGLYTNYNWGNTNLLTSAMVVFDTLYDAYSQGFYSPTPGSVKLDTIWAQMQYENSSGLPDTVIFQVYSVNASGLPHKATKGHNPTIIYGADTLIVKPNKLTVVPAISSIDISVAQNYPNPFSNSTQIKYTLAKSADVSFTVSDMTGRILINNTYSNSAAGDHTINLNANSLSPGVYFYTFNIGGMKITKNMVITKE